MSAITSPTTPKNTSRILGEAPPIRALLGLIHKVASTKTNILIIGESGTGKELVARMIHDEGPLKDKPFVPVNCGAIPENLIESEMFGHKRGSFTGAVMEKMGLFEAAHTGSLFLDEVGELPLQMQVKLLRALQERVIRKVGGTDDLKVDVRVIAATNRDLEAAVRAGTFREDLYYRLNVILIKTPPLRERKSDIPPLAEHFLKKINTKYKKNLEGFEPEVMRMLQEYPWPGNVRELENAIERVVTLENSTKVTASSLSQAIINSAALAATAAALLNTSGAPGVASPLSGSQVTGSHSPKELKLPAADFSKGALNLDEILGEVEKTYLMSALEHTGGVKKRAADLLGITFRSIRYRLKKLGVDHRDSDDDLDEA
jgi:two-component system response regulator PilR (NtrC family)